MRIALGYQVLFALIGGIAAGLFLGPLALYFRPIGTVYVTLLQTIVLPYICLSLILGLGSLTPANAKKLLNNGWRFWILLWGIVFIFIFLLCYLIPKPLAGLFLQESSSAKELHAVLTKNILTYLIPANPLYDLLNNIVPAIAVLGVIVGFTLMLIENKEPLLGLVRRGEEVFEKILEWLALIAPVGVFAHIAIVMGTVQLSDLYKIDFYIISYLLTALFITLWILPLILSGLTPLAFKEALHAFRSVCLLSFITGVPTIAIPLMNRYFKKLREKESLKDAGGYRTAIETVVPISYAFVQIGNAFLLFFIFFASFYYRHPFTFGEKTLLSFLTVPLSVGSPGTSVNSVVFLFKELNFPDNALELFTATMPVTVNFQVFLSVASVLTFILLVIYANFHLIEIKWKRLMIQFAGSVLLAGAVILSIRPFIHIDDHFRNFYPSRKISDVVKDPVKAVIYHPGQTLDYLASIDPAESVLGRILRSNSLRVAYLPGSIPFSYWNQDNDLAGFDVAMAYQLAKDLGCQLEFIPLDYDRIAEDLNRGAYDIAMTGILMTEDRIQKMDFTNSYINQNNALIIHESKRPFFKSLGKAKENNQLTIAALGAYVKILEQNFPAANLYRGPYDAEEIPAREFDAIIWSRIQSAAWCLSHPDFYVEDYDGQLGKSLFAYPVKTNEPEFLRFINSWISLKNLDGFYKKQENYWLYGNSPARKGEPRWSILHNVLHWVQ